MNYMKSLCCIVAIFSVLGCSPKRTEEDQFFYSASSKLAQNFFKNISSGQFKNASSVVVDNFEYYEYHPDREKKLLASKEEFLKKAPKIFEKIKNPLTFLGKIEKYPWYMYVFGFDFEDEQYKRFCNLKIIKNKINEVRCYIGAKESNKLLKTHFPVESRNKHLMLFRQSSDEYNAHKNPRCDPKKEMDYFKFYPTYTKNVTAKIDDNCASMENYFREADPSTLKLRSWHNPPWAARNIVFSSRYKRIDRVGIFKGYDGVVDEIHDYIPLEAFLFREYLVNIGVVGSVSSLYPPYVKNLLSAWIVQQQNEPLLNLSENNEVIPGLAKSYSWNEEKTRITLKLNAFKRYSDGTYLEAKDLKESWENSLGLPKEKLNENIYKFFSQTEGFSHNKRLPGIKVHDEQTLSIKFKKAFPQATHYLASVIFAPYKQLGERFIGTGPFFIWRGVEESDKASLWPNRFYPAKMTSVKFFNTNSKNEKLKEKEIHMHISFKEPGEEACVRKREGWSCKTSSSFGFPLSLNNDSDNGKIEFFYKTSRFNPDLKQPKDFLKFSKLFDQKNFKLKPETREMIEWERKVSVK